MMAPRRSFIVAVTLMACLSLAPAQARQSAVEMTTLPYATRAGQELLLNLYLPKDAARPLPVIVFLHGGGWSGGTRTTGPDFRRFFAQDGFAMASIEYRLTPSVTFPSNVEDVKTAVRWLRANAATHGLNADRICLWGTSAGGHLAAVAALAPRSCIFEGADNLNQSSAVRCVLDAYGPVDFAQMDTQTEREKATLQPQPPALLAAPPMVGGVVGGAARGEGAGRGGEAVGGNTAPAARGAGRGGPTPHDAPSSPESRLIGAPVQSVPDRVRAASPQTYVSGEAPAFLIMHGLADNSVPHGQSVLLYEALARAGADATLRLIDGLPPHVLQPHESRRTGGAVPDGRAGASERWRGGAETIARASSTSRATFSGSTCVELFGALLLQPDVAERDLARAVLLDLQGDHARRLAARRVVVDEDHHELTIDDVGERVAVGDDVEPVPLAGLDHALHCVAIADRSDRARPFVRLHAHDVAPPADLGFRASASVLHIAVVVQGVVEVERVAGDVPVRVGWPAKAAAGHGLVSLRVPSRPSPRWWLWPDPSAIEHTAVNVEVRLDLEFQLEVRRLAAAPDDERPPEPSFGCTLGGDRAVLDLPDLRVSVPAIERSAVKDLRSSRRRPCSRSAPARCRNQRMGARRPGPPWALAFRLRVESATRTLAGVQNAASLARRR